MPAPPVAAPATRAPEDLDLLLARGTRTSVRRFRRFISSSGNSHDETDKYRHSVMITECRYLSVTSWLLLQQEMKRRNYITSCGTTADRGAAVAAHVRRARGGGVRGAGLDEYDGLARPSAAGSVMPYFKAKKGFKSRSTSLICHRLSCSDF